MYISPRRRYAGPRGVATWPCVPRRIHLRGPIFYFYYFYFFIISLFIKNGLKIENKIRKTV